MPKRKQRSSEDEDDETPEPARKLSKKEKAAKLAEGRERARAWAEAQKKKKAKATTVASETAASGANDGGTPAAGLAGTPTRRKAAAGLTGTPTRRKASGRTSTGSAKKAKTSTTPATKKAAAVPTASPATAKQTPGRRGRKPTGGGKPPTSTPDAVMKEAGEDDGEAKPAASTTKHTKKEELRLAKLRAKQWAQEQFGPKEGTSSSPAVPKVPPAIEAAKELEPSSSPLTQQQLENGPIPLPRHRMPSAGYAGCGPTPTVAQLSGQAASISSYAASIGKHPFAPAPMSSVPALEQPYAPAPIVPSSVAAAGISAAAEFRAAAANVSEAHKQSVLPLSPPQPAANNLMEVAYNESQRIRLHKKEGAAAKAEEEQESGIETKEDKASADGDANVSEPSLVGKVAARFTSAFWFIVKCIFALVALSLFVLVAIPFLVDISSSSTKEAKNATSISKVDDGISAPCFQNSVDVPVDEEGKVVMDQLNMWYAVEGPPKGFGQPSCSTPEHPVPCPENGRCSGGYLRGCQSISDCAALGVPLRDCYGSGGGFYAVSETFSECTLSPKAMEVANAMEKTLIDLAVEQTCSVGCKLGITECSVRPQEIVTSNILSMKGDQAQLTSDSPLFTLEGLARLMNANRNDEATMKINVELLSFLLPHLDPSRVQYHAMDDPSSSVVGLTSAYVRDSLPIPAFCWLRLFLVENIGSLVKTTWSFCSLLVKSVWKIGVSYPLPTLSFFLFTYIAFWVQKHRRRRVKTRAIVSRIREMAVDKLAECDDGEGYPVLMLRDDIVHELYPTSMQDRKKMIADVWPRVVSEVRSDNRIRKYKKTEGGKLLEHWEFTATAAKKSRKRRSMQ